MVRVRITKRQVVWTAVVILICGVAFWAYRTVNDSAEGTIVQSPAPVAAKERYNKIRSDYAVFEIPTTFTAVSSSEPVAPVLKNYNFIKQQFGSWQLAIHITRLPSGSLSDDGTYNYRNVTTGQYSKAVKQYGDHRAIIFTDTSTPTFTKVGYLTNGTLSASVSLMGGTPEVSTDMQATLDRILSTWQWL